jgi:cytochrome P450
MKIHPEVPSSIRALAAVLSQPKPMRRGSVSERTMKCGKAGCPCQEDPKARHGLYYSLTRPMAGKTHSRYLSPEQAQLARQQIEQGLTFREQVEQYREACEQWADAQLERFPAASREAAEKGGSKATFKTKSSGKSKRS